MAMTYEITISGKTINFLKELYLVYDSKLSKSNITSTPIVLLAKVLLHVKYSKLACFNQDSESVVQISLYFYYVITLSTPCSILWWTVRHLFWEWQPNCRHDSNFRRIRALSPQTELVCLYVYTLLLGWLALSSNQIRHIIFWKWFTAVL